MITDNKIIKSLFDIDYIKLYKLAESLSPDYQNAAPFPNCTIDNFFKKSTYTNILNTFPSQDSEIWKTPSNIHCKNKSVTKQGDIGIKEYLFNENQRRLFMELHSSLFILFLEKLTGITGLIPDPYFAEGSYAMSKSNGFLDIHADFSHHNKLGLERRLNVLIYLNDEWDEDYEGALSFYNKELKPVKKIFPIANRIAIFTTSGDSFHGFPEPIKCPENVVRKSINLYFYTVPRSERDVRTILFPKDPSFILEETKD